ncbi:hypothetical protein [Moorena bouillonii]|nr:hypothetical protein [Moorena bouillonii]
MDMIPDEIAKLSLFAHPSLLNGICSVVAGVNKGSYATLVGM